MTDDFAGELEPGDSLAGDLLEEEAVAAEDSGSERLLEAYAEDDARGGAEEAVAMHEVIVTSTDLDRNDVAGDAGGEGDGSGRSVSAVLGHEESSTACDTLEDPEETTAPGVLGVGGHLDGLAHPGELAGLGDHGIIVIERELEDGHGSTDDTMLHELSRDSWVGGTPRTKSVQNLPNKQLRSGPQDPRMCWRRVKYGILPLRLRSGAE